MTIDQIALLLAFGAVIGILYPHALYPVVLGLLRGIAAKPARSAPHVTRVDVCVAAHNEAAVIERCIRSILDQRYDPTLLRVVVGSDGSTDDTVLRARAMRDASERITVLDLPRSGKNTTLNAIMAACTADIVVFTDADCVLHPDAITQLTQAFADERVGAAIGRNDRTMHSSADDAGTRNEALYRRMDDVVTAWESDIHSTVTSNGALYAVRRSLIEPLPGARVADDLYHLISIQRRGHRTVFVPTATAVELRENDMGREAVRTIRTASAGIATVFRAPSIALRWHGWPTFFHWSHRVMRWSGPFFLIVLFAASIMSVSNTTQFGVLFYGQLFAYALALLGYAADRFGQRVPIASQAQFFVLMNACFLLAWFRAAGASSIDRWEPTA
jgi:cellulose synthase/poly-beta-1,6-N-acetylglucosamine synthase-like glycosyltransferase